MLYVCDGEHCSPLVFAILDSRSHIGICYIVNAGT
jgi:hypothetical protein